MTPLKVKWVVLLLNYPFCIVHVYDLIITVKTCYILSIRESVHFVVDFFKIFFLSVWTPEI